MTVGNGPKLVVMVRSDTLEISWISKPQTTATQIYEGTNQIQRVVVAKKLLGG